MVASHSDSGEYRAINYLQERSRTLTEALLARQLEALGEANRERFLALSERSVARQLDALGEANRERLRALSEPFAHLESLRGIESTFSDLQRENMRALPALGSRQPSVAGIPSVRLPAHTNSELARVKRQLKQAHETIQTQEAELEAKQVEVNNAIVERDNAIAECDNAIAQLGKERKHLAQTEKLASDILEINEDMQRENKELKEKLSDAAWYCHSFA